MIEVACRMIADQIRFRVRNFRSVCERTWMGCEYVCVSREADNI